MGKRPSSTEGRITNLMVVALCCAALFLGIGDDTPPPTVVNPPVPKVARTAPDAEKAKLPYPFPGVTVVPVVVEVEEEEAAYLLRIDLPMFWKTLSVDEQRSVKKLPQLMDLVKKHLHMQEKKHEPTTIMPSKFV